MKARNTDAASPVGSVSAVGAVPASGAASEDGVTIAASSVVAGLGFRAQATVASLRGALQAAYRAIESTTDSVPVVTALATAEDKATHPALIDLARELALPLLAVPLEQLAGQTPFSPTIPATVAKGIDIPRDPSARAASYRIPERYGTRSVAESSALAAAGQGGRLLAPRAVSTDQMATAAIAVARSNPAPSSTSIANIPHPIL